MTTTDAPRMGLSREERKDKQHRRQVMGGLFVQAARRPNQPRARAGTGMTPEVETQARRAGDPSACVGVDAAASGEVLEDVGDRWSEDDGAGKLGWVDRLPIA